MELANAKFDICITKWLIKHNASRNNTERREIRCWMCNDACMPNLHRAAFCYESHGSLHLGALHSSIVTYPLPQAQDIENSNIRLGRVYSLRKTGRVGKNRHYFHGGTLPGNIYRVVLDLSMHRPRNKTNVTRCSVERDKILFRRLFKYSCVIIVSFEIDLTSLFIC